MKSIKYQKRVSKVYIIGYIGYIKVEFIIPRPNYYSAYTLIKYMRLLSSTQSTRNYNEYFR